MAQKTILVQDQPAQRGRDNLRQIITLPLNDPEHPNNFSRSKKLLISFVISLTFIQSTLGSSLPSNAVQYIAETFDVESKTQHVLPISIFLIGLCFAAIVSGPLSENFGRKPVVLVSFTLFAIFSMACAVTPNWSLFLFFRFCCGASASAPMVCSSGIFADMYAVPRARGRTMAFYIVTTTMAPMCAPALSGFIAENTTWRWVFGVGALLATVTIPAVAVLPETYAPVLLRHRAARMRKETGNPNIVAQSDLQQRSFKYVMTIVMTRPLRMLFQELIVSTTSTYLALIYAIYYLYFQAYSIIFLGPTSIYKFSPGLAGLTLLPIGLGGIVAGGVFLVWDWYLARAQARGDPWSRKEESRRLPLALFGAPLYAASILWLGWSARPGVFWLAPVASGITFGMGIVLIFIAMTNYLSDSYLTFSASAQGMASTCRSLLGVLLPLAAPTMFGTLGIAWACSTLAFLAMAFGTLPFLFMKFGEKIRAGSKFCQEVRALHEKELEDRDVNSTSNVIAP